MRGLWSDIPQVNKFEQVSSFGHQMPEPCRIEGTEVNKFAQVSRCHYWKVPIQWGIVTGGFMWGGVVRSNATWIMVTL